MRSIDMFRHFLLCILPAYQHANMACILSVAALIPALIHILDRYNLDRYNLDRPLLQGKGCKFKKPLSVERNIKKRRQKDKASVIRMQALLRVRRR